jgi:glycosyltransferase involved in cell wall biosynthesis
MQPPSISVILPVYNAADTLPACLESLLRQTLTEHEVIAVDDGSCDRSAAILSRFAEQDSRVRVIRTPHRGIVASLNHAIAEARAPFLARMDADDQAFPERFDVQIAWLQRHPHVGLIGSRVEFGGDPRSQRGYRTYVDWTNSLVTEAEISMNRFVESPFAHPSVMFRRELPERFGAYRDGPFPEDYECWLRWLDAGVRMAKCPEVLLRWNDPPERLSRTDPRYDIRAFYACKAEYLARWLERHNPFAPDVVVWGAGRETRKRAELVTAHGVRIRAYIDIDPRRIGQIIHGRPVTCFLLPFVGSRGAREDIRSRLVALGYREGRDFIAAA